jgi:dienelactone hydrolase
MDSGSGIVWFRGKSEMLQTDLIEDDRPIQLETIIFRPSGRGPFPLAVFNHGSTGKHATPGLAKESWVSLEVADFLNKRGWLVAFPQRRGRGKSDGVYDEGECNADALTGADRALTDVDAAIAVLRRRQDIDPGRLLIGGQSRGGALSVAYAGMHPEKTLGAINFVGGWLSEDCSAAESANQTLFQRGAPFDRSTIWLYGQGDHYYSIAHSKNNFAAFEKAGGQGKFFEFDTPSDIGHNVIHYPDLWGGPISDYLNSVSGKR